MVYFERTQYQNYCWKIKKSFLHLIVDSHLGSLPSRSIYLEKKQSVYFQIEVVYLIQIGLRSKLLRNFDFNIAKMTLT